MENTAMETYKSYLQTKVFVLYEYFKDIDHRPYLSYTLSDNTHPCIWNYPPRKVRAGWTGLLVVAHGVIAVKMKEVDALCIPLVYSFHSHRGHILSCFLSANIYKGPVQKHAGRGNSQHMVLKKCLSVLWQAYIVYIYQLYAYVWNFLILFFECVLFNPASWGVLIPLLTKKRNGTPFSIIIFAYFI